MRTVNQAAPVATNAAETATHQISDTCGIASQSKAVSANTGKKSTPHHMRKKKGRNGGMRIRRTFSNEPGQRMESHLRATPFYRPLKASAASVLGQRFATLGTDSGLAHRIRTLRAEAAPQPEL